MKQYYYKDNSCLATGNDEPDCICWHDEGTGPHHEWRYVEGNTDTCCISWRDKPEEINSDSFSYTPLFVGDGMQKPIVTIANDGTVTIHKEGGDKEAARLFYEALEIEGKTLHQRIKELEAELNQYNAPPEIYTVECEGNVAPIGTTCPETRLHVMNEAQVSTSEKIKVMEAFVRGEQIECKHRTYLGAEWKEPVGPFWDWTNLDYRVKPKEPRTFYVNEYGRCFGDIKASKEEVQKNAGIGSRILKLVEVLEE